MSLHFGKFIAKPTYTPIDEGISWMDNRSIQGIGLVQTEHPHEDRDTGTTYSISGHQLKSARGDSFTATVCETGYGIRCYLPLMEIKFSDYGGRGRQPQPLLKIDIADREAIHRADRKMVTRCEDLPLHHQELIADVLAMHAEMSEKLGVKPHQIPAQSPDSADL